MEEHNEGEMSDQEHGNPWTEEQWERFMRRSEVRSAKFGELLETLRDHPNRDEIIDQEMGWDRVGREPWVDLPQSCHDTDEADMELSSEEMADLSRRHNEELHVIPAYEHGFAFGLRVHHALKKFIKDDNSKADEMLTEAITQAMTIGAKIAGGHGMGYEDDVLCGNIVCCCRALAAADRCLAGLKLLKAKGVVAGAVIDPLIASGSRIHALVEQRITELRTRVWWTK